MTSNLRFTPLYGGGKYEPLCYLLEIDDAKLLLDCGWDYEFNLETIAPLENMDLSEIQGVLISYPDIHHLGALPYLFSKKNLNCPIYATYPVWKMGQYYLYDAYQGLIENWVDFELFSLADIDELFLGKHFNQLKFSQELKILDDKVLITPYCAGHIIGGSIWRIIKDTDVILYAVDYNHRRERHLSESYVATFQRPTLLITDSYNLDNDQVFKRQALDNSLTNAALATLRNGGNVLVPTDAAGRIFEIGSVLYNFWRKNMLFNDYPLVFLSYTGKHSTEAIKSMLEWMNEDCRRKFDEDRKNVFKWSKFIVARNLDELKRLAHPPMCVLATNIFCENGFSQDLLQEWCSSSQNCVLLTERVKKDSVAGQLFTIMEERKKRSGLNTINFQARVKVPLQGEELVDFLEKKRIEEEERKRKKEEELLMMEEEPSDEEMEDVQEANTAISSQSRFPMFNWSVNDDPFDVYGAPMDFSTFEDVNTESNDFLRGNSSPGKRDGGEDEKQPYKSVLQTQSLNIQCQIKFVNFEGRADGRSVKSILQYMSPKKVILVHGSDIAKAKLKSFCENNNQVQTSVPNNTEDINVSSSTKVFKLQLENILDQKLKFYNVSDNYQVSYVEGIVGMTEDGPILREVPEDERKKFQHQALYMGDMNLLDVKNKIHNGGVESKLVSGIVVAGRDQLVRIEKKSNTNLKLKGILGKDYFNVRKLLYSNYDIL